jgi:hypothetical protein
MSRPKRWSSGVEGRIMIHCPWAPALLGSALSLVTATQPTATLDLSAQAAFARTMSSVNGASERKPIGFVLSVNGQWLADGKALKVGQELVSSANLSLSPMTPIGAGRSISVVLIDGRRLSHPCSTRAACAFQLPPSLQDSPMSSRITQAFRLIFGQPERYVSALSRGTRDPRGALSDGVLRVDDRRLLLSDWMRGIAPGSYQLRFRAAATSDQEAITIPITWSGTELSVDVASTIRRGVYSAQLLSSLVDGADPIGVEAWVLVESSGSYQRSRDAYLEAETMTNRWGADVSERERRLFLRAILDELANRQ